MLEMLMYKCATRAEQVSLVGGSALLSLVCFGVAKFGLGMGTAAVMTETSSRSQRKAVGEISVYGYAICGVAGLLALVFGFLCLLNLVRFLLGTGLEDSGEER